MSERWFDAASIPGESEPVELDPAEGRHATRSRQLENGEEIALSNGAGTTARAILSEGEHDRLVMVGPEGGSGEAEIAELEAAGGRRFALGLATLRIETAAAAALTVLALGD